MLVDKQYCMSSFLTFRTVMDDNKCFFDGVYPHKTSRNNNRAQIHNADELFLSLKEQLDRVLRNRKAALALSGGIDSAILARLMPEGSTAYTFKCVVEGVEVIDETIRAKRYAEKCGLIHKTVEIYWEDFEELSPILMGHKGSPMHSIEVQIYKAALQAKADGFETLIFGEGADAIYGGLDGLFSKDWTIGEFIDRYSFVNPVKVLKDPCLVLQPFKEREKEGLIDVQGFLIDMLEKEYLNSYYNACETAEIEFFSPYANTELVIPLDIGKIRNGNSKYIVRDIFNKLYPDLEVPRKIPMPRAMNEWLENWAGPIRDEFWEKCCKDMTGDQKWLLWCLERFLNLYD